MLEFFKLTPRTRRLSLTLPAPRGMALTYPATVFLLWQVCAGHIRSHSSQLHPGSDPSLHTLASTSEPLMAGPRGFRSFHDTSIACTFHNSFEHFNSTTLMCSSPSHRFVYRKPPFFPTYASLPPVCPLVTMDNLTQCYLITCAQQVFSPNPRLHLHGQPPPTRHTAQVGPARAEPQQTPSHLMFTFYMRTPTLVPGVGRTCLVLVFAQSGQSQA